MTDPLDSSRSRSVFTDVTNRTFPLFADITKLQKFVDNYLNHARYQGHYYFKVSMPMVFMELLDYGEMSSRSTGDAHTSQQELLFMIALDWYVQCDDGDQLFEGKPYKAHIHPQAIVTPFIFVDNPLSVMAGRELFGWPKSLVSVEPSNDIWMPGPGSGPRSVKIGAMRLAEVFHGKKQKYKTTLEIERRAGFPLETGGLPLNYFSMATRWWSAWAPNYQSLVAQWSQLLRFNFTPSSLTQQMIDLYKLLMLGGTGGGAVPQGLFEPYSNSIELKQFRDSDNPETTCFMAMANMRSEVTAVNGMGMLGSIESMFTSMDGGYSIKIHRFPAYPVVEKLGLVVSHTEAAPEDEEDAVAIDTLTPCMPFWINMDFIVRGAEPLATLVHGKFVEDPPKESELPPYELERKFVVEEES